MLPALLLAGCRIHFVERGPEPHGTVSGGQFGNIHSLAFEARQNLTPALRRLAQPIFDCQKALLATGRDAKNYKRTELVFLAPKAAVNTVSPDIDDWLVVQMCVSSAVIFVGPIALTA